MSNKGVRGKWSYAYSTRVSVPTYSTMHSRRLVQARGKASDFLCVDCGGEARDWSYIGGDSDEIIAQDRKHFGKAYSLNPEFYAPRCRSCHIQFDKNDLCRNGLHSMSDPTNWYIDQRRNSKNCRACRQMRDARRKNPRSRQALRIGGTQATKTQEKPAAVAG